MYHNCIFCSADLKSNDALERFPVGGSIAFDGEKGRLWAVCPRCARWNLAPIEERWEAVEDMERLFRCTRTRAQRENIGLARLPDGTRLVRVGTAGPGELAAWRYGRHLVRRRRGYLLAAGTIAATGTAAAVATTAAVVAAAASLPFVLWTGEGVFTAAEAVFTAVGQGTSRLWHLGTDRRVLLRLSREEAAADGRPWLRKRDFRGAYLRWDEDTRTATVQVPAAGGRFLSLDGPRARTALGRSLAIMNVRGASPRQLEGAVRQLSGAGSAERWLERAAREGLTLELPPRSDTYWQRRSRHEGLGMSTINWVQAQSLRVLGGRSVFGTNAYLQMRAVALEMALHEETERQALEGELAALEEMWRQAEEIAAIADRLPGDVPATEPPRMGGTTRL